MATMKAVQVTKAGGDFELVERPIPEPERNQVRIKVEACGVCHSDVMVKDGLWPELAYPRIPGHEIAGRIDSVGADVKIWKAGQRVGVGWHGGHCFTCDPCRRGDFILCRFEKITSLSFDGGYAEYMVAPAEAVAKMPDDLPSAEAAPLLCAGVTVYNPLRNSGARAGDLVAVQGIGGLGHLGIQCGRQMGFRTVAIGRGADKDAFVRKLGTHEYIDGAVSAPAESLQKLGGARVILATAPDAKAISALVDGLAPGGKLVVVGAAPEPLSISPLQIILTRRSVLGWPSGTAKDSEDTLAFSSLTGFTVECGRAPSLGAYGRALPMELLLRGKYLLTSATESRVLTDAAVLVTGNSVAEVGDWPTLRGKHPEARVVGNGKQLLLPGLIDAHSHGRAISPIQKGVLNDYLENNLLDWAIMPPFDPELTAALGVVRHVRSGCTTLHHMGFDTEGPRALDLCERAIRTYLEGGLRLAFSPGVRNVDKLVLDSQAFLATLPADLRAFAEPLVNLDSAGVERDYFDLFDHLYGKFNSDDTRILLSPSWAQAVTESFLARTRETSLRLGKVPIHMHCLQTPIQKAFSLRRYGQTAVAWLDERGLIDEQVALGHAIWVTDRDIDILAARRASITSHPSCNLGMRNGLAPVYEMVRRGVNVALGLDDKTINDDEDAVMELRMLHKLHRVPSYDLTTPPLSAREVLAMGTLNGARALGFAGRVGALTPGMKADAILVDLDRVLDDPWLTGELDIVEAFLHRAMGADVASAVIGGRVVMEDRAFLTVDVPALYQEIRRAAKSIGDEQRRRAEMLQRLKPYYQRWYGEWLGGPTQPFYVLNSRI